MACSSVQLIAHDWNNGVNVSPLRGPLNFSNGQAPLVPFAGADWNKYKGFFDLCPGNQGEIPVPKEQEINYNEPKLDSRYRSWKDHCDYKTYCKLRKFLDWYHVAGEDNYDNLKSYNSWKNSCWVRHYQDNYYYNDYVSWKRCYTLSDQEIWKKWKAWKKYKKTGYKKYLLSSFAKSNRNRKRYNRFRKTASLKDYCKFRRYCDWLLHCNQLGLPKDDRKAYQKWKTYNNENYAHLNDFAGEYKIWRQESNDDGFQNWLLWQEEKKMKGQSYHSTESSCPSSTISDISMSCPSEKQKEKYGYYRKYPKNTYKRRRNY